MNEKIVSMTDAIGHPIVAGDYVTAVWAGGDVALFEVADFKTNMQARKWRYREDVLLLKRTSKDDVSEVTQNKLIKKTSSQVTWVDKNYVMLYFLSK